MTKLFRRNKLAKHFSDKLFKNLNRKLKFATYVVKKMRKNP
ncbi:hypothetical protein M899_0233 [Bacteriovorax sp. BSW11_IV]|nr:hypothetical protein M899_0233 [Bacteriovorax sp. BSW11_IV]